MATETNYETQHLSGEEARDKVRGLLKNFRSTMMVTHANGHLHSRPMGLHGNAGDFDGVLWFFTDRDGRKVEEINSDASISLIFQSDSDSDHLWIRTYDSTIWNT